MFDHRRINALDSRESSPTRSGSLTVYAPGHASSSEEDNSDDDILELNVSSKTPVRNRPSEAQMGQIRPSTTRSVLTARDIELLYLVCHAADKVDHDKKDSLNYAGLYGTLQTFFDTNGLTSKSFPSYNLCIYATMLLCSYDLPTWSERLDAFIRENKSKVALSRVFHVVRSATDERISIKFLRFWLARTAYLRKKAAGMEMVAINHDTRSLTKESLRCWLYRMDRDRLGTRRANALYSKTLALLLIRTLKNKKTKSIGLRKREKDFELGVPFMKWLQRSNTMTRSTEQADQIYHQNTQRKYLLSWLYAAFEQKTQENYEGFLVKKHFFCWIDKSDTIQALNEEGRDMQFAFHAGKVFEKWICTLDDRRADRKLADKILWRNIMIKYKNRWMFETDMRIKFNIVHQSSNKNLISRTFSFWRSSTESRLESDRFRRFMLLKNVLKNWRLETGRKALQSEMNRSIAQDKFHNWLIKERLILIQRYFDAKSVEHYFRVWLRLTVKKYKRNSRNRTKALTTHNKNLLKDTLNEWISRTYQHAKNDVRSAELRIFFLTSTPFFIMRIKAETCAKNEIIANSIYEKGTLKQVFRNWQNRTARRVSYRMSIVKKQFDATHSRQTQKNFFTIWRNAFLIVEQNNEIAQLSLDYSEMGVKSKVMEMWRNHFEKNTNALQTATLIYNDTLQRKSLGEWMIKQNLMTRMEQDAAFLAEVKDLKVQEDLYRRWRMHAFRIASQQRNADEFLIRIRNSRFRKIWRIWLIKAQEAEHRRPETPTSPTPYRDDDRMLSHTTSIMETPSRVRYKTFVPATTVDRWRRMTMRNTPLRTPATPSTRIARNPSRMAATERPRRIFAADMRG